MVALEAGLALFSACHLLEPVADGHVVRCIIHRKLQVEAIDEVVKVEDLCFSDCNGDVGQLDWGAARGLDICVLAEDQSS